MSVLTKIFVVMLVVLSLLLSAATITFVGSIDDYKRTADAQTAALQGAQAELASVRNNAALAERQAGEALAAATAGQQKLNDDLANANRQIADLGAQLAAARSQATIAEANVSKLTSAVAASEATKSSLQQQVADLRGTNDRLQTQNGELNVALTDSSNRLSITEEARRLAAEQLTELRTQLDRVSGALRDRGIDPNRVAVSGLTAGAPPINGVIRQTRPIMGIPHAQISVGSEDAVKVGMEFNILDRASGKYLGKLTVVAVEPNEAVGRLSGPDVGSITAGAEVRTQL